jgi:hypothetical protein
MIFAALPLRWEGSMIKLPDLPPPPYRHPMSGESIYDENAMRAYALQAIREFVDEQKVVAWASSFAMLALRDTGHATVLRQERAFHHCPLIIKPELDDAIE